MPCWLTRLHVCASQVLLFSLFFDDMVHAYVWHVVRYCLDEGVEAKFIRHGVVNALYTNISKTEFRGRSLKFGAEF